MYKKIIITIIFLIHIKISFAQLNIQLLIEKGKECLNNQQFTEAIQYFSTVLNVKTDMDNVFWLRAIAKYNLSDYQGAAIDFSKALNINPYNPYYLLYRGMAREKLYDFNGALSDYNQAIEIEPDNPEHYFHRGINYLVLKMNEKAIDDFNMVIKFNRNSSEAISFRALAFQGMQNFEKAIQDFDNALRKNKLNADLYIKRGRCYVEMKKSAQALTDFNSAISLDQTNTYAYFNRAYTKTETNDFLGAIEDYSKVIDLEKDNALSYYNRALIHAKISNYDAAIADFSKVLEYSPEHVFTWLNRGIMYHIKNNFNAAIRDYTQAITIFPDFAQAYLNRSQAYASINEQKKAWIDLKTAKEINKLIDSVPLLIDSVNVAKIMELHANFDQGNKKSLNENDEMEDIFPFPVFVINLSDSLSIISDFRYSNEKIEKINNLINKPLYFLGLQENSQAIVDNRIDNFLSKYSLSNTYIDHFTIAILNSKLQNYNTAIEEYDLLINIKPDFALAYFNKANTQLQMINFIQSISDYNTTISIDKNSVTNLVTQSDDNYIADYQPVIDNYSLTVKTDPGFFPAYYNRANVKADSGDYLGAINDYTLAIINEPEFKEAYYNRGLTYIHIKQKDRGCLDMSKAGELGVKQAYNVIKKYCK